MTTMRRLGSSSVSSSRTTSPWWMRDMWDSCWTQSLNLWRTFRRERKNQQWPSEHWVTHCTPCWRHWPRDEAWDWCKECRIGMGSKRGDRWRPRTRRKPRVGDSQCCKLCYSLEWVTIQQSLRKRGIRENTRWTSTKISPQKSWTMTWRPAWCWRNAHRDCGIICWWTLLFPLLLPLLLLPLYLLLLLLPLLLLLLLPFSLLLPIESTSIGTVSLKPFTIHVLFVFR